MMWNAEWNVLIQTLRFPTQKRNVCWEASTFDSILVATGDVLSNCSSTADDWYKYRRRATKGKQEYEVVAICAV